jgi:hypothetical protein
MTSSHGRTTLCFVVAAMAVALAAACTPVQTQTTPGTATASSTASPTTAPTPSLPAATASPSPAAAACTAAQLVAKVQQWEGAAGHRIATVELTNSGAACALASLDQPQLVDGVDTVLIDGTPPAAPATVMFGAGGKLHTLVQDGNYCGPAPIVPVTVAFVLPGGVGRIVAAPVTPEDSGGVPPCNGPSQPGDIEMQPWGP